MGEEGEGSRKMGEEGEGSRKMGEEGEGSRKMGGGGSRKMEGEEGVGRWGGGGGSRMMGGEEEGVGRREECKVRTNLKHPVDLVCACACTGVVHTMYLMCSTTHTYMYVHTQHTWEVCVLHGIQTHNYHHTKKPSSQ